jgi:uncharacterized protein (DUF433 family)
MSTPERTWRHLAPNPKSSYKQLFLKGRRIRAEVLYGWTVDGDEPRTPEEVAADYGIPLEAVLEAIAYCESDPPEVREDHLEEEIRMEAAGFNDPEYKRTGKTRPYTPEDLARLRELRLRG